MRFSLLFLVACGTAQEPAPDAGATCEPAGTWNLRYRPDAGEFCPPSGETLTVVPTDGGWHASLSQIGPISESCPELDGGRRSGTVQPGSTVTFDAASCTLDVSVRRGYCFSSEWNCDSRKLKLTFAGDAVSGDGLSGRCWCATNTESVGQVFVTGAREL